MPNVRVYFKQNGRLSVTVGAEVISFVQRTQSRRAVYVHNTTQSNTPFSDTGAGGGRYFNASTIRHTQYDAGCCTDILEPVACNKRLASVVVAALRVQVLLARPIPNVAREVRPEIAVVEILPSAQRMSPPVPDRSIVFVFGVSCSARCTAIATSGIMVSCRPACRVVPGGVAGRQRRLGRGRQPVRRIPAAVATNLQQAGQRLLTK